jgi:hypothetical protein
VLDVGGCWIGTLEHMSKTPKQLPTTDNTRFPAKDPHPSHRKFRMEANKLLFIDSFIHPIQIQIQIHFSHRWYFALQITERLRRCAATATASLAGGCSVALLPKGELALDPRSRCTIQSTPHSAVLVLVHTLLI